VVAKSYDVGDKWYYQQDNELYTSAGMLSIYRAVLSVDKTKLAMDLNRFSVNFICMFTQIMWFYVGLTTPFQIRSYVTTCGAELN
jgi:hypothetical protein